VGFRRLIRAGANEALKESVGRFEVCFRQERTYGSLRRMFGARLRGLEFGPDVHRRVGSEGRVCVLALKKESPREHGLAPRSWFAHLALVAAPL
jgi:hypothetical protein